MPTPTRGDARPATPAAVGLVVGGVLAGVLAAAVVGLGGSPTGTGTPDPAPTDPVFGEPQTEVTTPYAPPPWIPDRPTAG